MKHAENGKFLFSELVLQEQKNAASLATRRVKESIN
jgi:hypothetical protein